jgi:hypothetical protein
VDLIYDEDLGWAAIGEGQRRVIPVFTRKARSNGESERALELLSPPAREAVEGSKQATKKWQSLVQTVGQQLAIEHAEVSTLEGMTDGAADAVSKMMQDWRAGHTPDAQVLAGLAGVEADFRPRLDIVISHVQQASSRPESLTVVGGARMYVKAMFHIARLYLTKSVTVIDGQQATWAKEAWIGACDSWDAATGRSELPFVGY